MLPEMGPPGTTIWEYPGEEKSWQWELQGFERSVRTRKSCGPTLGDAWATMRIVDRIYKKTTE
jgi:predicted dehydrogenase